MHRISPGPPWRLLALVLAVVYIFCCCPSVGATGSNVFGVIGGQFTRLEPGATRAANLRGRQLQQQAASFACPRTDVRAFDTNNLTATASVLVPHTAASCWAFDFRMVLVDAYISTINGSVVRMNATYEGTLILAEPVRTCNSTWNLTEAFEQYGPAFLESAHTLLSKPYNTTLPFNASRVCRDTKCGVGDDVCSLAVGQCPTRCGGCPSAQYDWALRITLMPAFEAVNPARCCDGLDCNSQADQFVNSIRSVGDVPQAPPPSQSPGTLGPAPAIAPSVDDTLPPPIPPELTAGRRTHLALGAAVGIAIGGVALLSACVLMAALLFKQRRRQLAKLPDLQPPQEGAEGASTHDAGSHDGALSSCASPHGSSPDGSTNSAHSTIDMARAFTGTEPAAACVLSKAGVDKAAGAAPTLTDDGSRRVTTGAVHSLNSARSSSSSLATPSMPGSYSTARVDTGRGASRPSTGRLFASDSGRSLDSAPLRPATWSSHGPGVAGSNPVDGLRIAWASIQMGGLLGQGGQGKVHKGEWEGTRVAVKMLNAGAMGDPRVWRDTLYQEALIMSELRHPCIARVYGFVDEAPHCALVMHRYASSLQSFMATPAYTRLTMAARLRLALQVATGMRFLHEKKPVPILHGNLKTSNLLLEDDGRVVIADFGLASSMRSGMQGDAMATGALTVSISPPEVLLAPLAPRTAAGDVFAFAIVLLEIVTGQPAYKDKRTVEVRHAVIDGKRPSIPDTVPYAVSVIIKHCWHPTPGKRPTFAEVASCLSDAADAAERSPPAAPPAATAALPAPPSPSAAASGTVTSSAAVDAPTVAPAATDAAGSS